MINSDFSAEDMDILQEISNIGSGNAATALSTMLNKTVMIDVPDIQFSLLSDVPTVLGGAEELMTAVIFKLSDFLDGYVVFILDDDSASKLYKVAAGEYNVEMKPVLQELSNIICGAYINAIATLVNKSIHISVPFLGRDMVGALIDVILSQMYLTCESTIVIKTDLRIEEQNISGHFILMLDDQMLKSLINTLKYGEGHE